MSDSFENVTIPTNLWVDIYALSGITVGTSISIQNIGVCDVYVAVQATQPAPDHDAYNIVYREGPPLRNSNGDAGAWAYCQGDGSKLNIRNVG